MTTTVTVRARAWGARVEVQGQEPLELGAHQDHNVHIAEGESATITVTHGEKPVDRAAQLQDEEVPGRRQNDELLGAGTTNESGADETAQSTPPGGGQPASVPGRGRGSRPATDEA